MLKNLANLVSVANNVVRIGHNLSATCSKRVKTALIAKKVEISGAAEIDFAVEKVPAGRSPFVHRGRRTVIAAEEEIMYVVALIG